MHVVCGVFVFVLLLGHCTFFFSDFFSVSFFMISLMVLTFLDIIAQCLLCSFSLPIATVGDHLFDNECVMGSRSGGVVVRDG